MDREKEIYKVTLAGSAVNVALTAFKFVAGIFGHSSAMVADAVHSLSDFLTDLVVLIFVRISGKPADKRHDYGHGKFETLATALIGVALLLVAGGILFNSGGALIGWFRGEELPAPGRLALWAAVISIVLKELTFQYTFRKGRKLNSPVVQANAWHHRSDALSSIGALVGIGGAVLLGGRWTVLDPVASLAVGFFIVLTAWKLLKDCIDDLTEASLPDEVEKEILDIVTAFPDVSDPHNLRTRRIGAHYAIELHIRMDGTISLDEAHSRSRDIEHALRERFGQQTHVAVHVEPRQ
ncbi:MAG: cation diffusion facilitator family transporter [Bacteroidales bacterium]|nr:cation diffusion facilitator family transporter [Bacteroidales bacterium]